MSEIEIRGARIHNLKNIDVNIPKNQIVIITGVSGSGKSSLAFDIIFQEGMRRYLQSIGFPPKVEKEKPFTSIKGLAPTIGIEQRFARMGNPRSTVGTYSTIYSMLRQLYALEGRQNCPICKIPVNDKLECDQCGMRVESLEIKHFSFNEPSGMCLECKGRGYQMDYEEQKLIPDPNWNILKILKAATGSFADLKNFAIGLAEAMNFDINTPYNQLPQEIQDIFLYGTEKELQFKWKSRRFEGTIAAKFEGVIPHLQRAMEKSTSAYRREKIEKNYMTKVLCKACGGYRINEQARNTFIAGKHIGEMASFTIDELIEFLENDLGTDGLRTSEGKAIRAEILKRLTKFGLVGLSYLSLNRNVPTLSGGELQRLSLMNQLNSELNGLIYVLDEPTLGMHQLEKKNLDLILHELKELGNSLIVVEHDKSIISIADHIIDMGPGPGIEGGEVIFKGTVDDLKANNSLTGQYLAGTLPFPKKTAEERRAMTEMTPKLVLSEVQTNNLKNIQVEIPLGLMVGIAGVSGSGKSSLISDTLVPLLKDHFSKKSANDNGEEEAEEEMEVQSVKGRVSGLENVSNLVMVSQSPIGRTKTSNPISYIGIWDNIRNIFAKLPLAKKRKYTAGHFSFNSDKGRCPKCKGEGTIDLQISFLSSVDIPCEECEGTGYLPEILEVTYKEKNIHEILNLSVRDALEVFAEDETIIRYLQILDEIGMGYIKLGQPATTLSGGEAQRIKLAKELGKAKKSGTVYVLDEPTTGLHAFDIAKLLTLLDQLVEQGNTVLVIEHDIDVLRYMDWIIELGPEGGPKGGELIAEGPPEVLAMQKNSKTGLFFSIA